MSLSSVPKGFSRLIAMLFKDQYVNTMMKLKMKAQNQCVVHDWTIKGVNSQWMRSKQSHACAYGNGKGIVEIMTPSCKDTMPSPSCWKTLERIGGGMLRTPVLMFSTISTSIHSRARATLHSACPSTGMDSASSPSGSMSSVLNALYGPPLLSSISASARAWRMLMSRMTRCLKHVILSLSSSENAQKAVRQLAASNQCERMAATWPHASQKRQ
mmetsp:Transcript_6268/g.16777  ORF Transcript_6268/g.16777 Transcript_6268/m.16777 type:complete len:214 (+) Transcript_6268:462-1103(+)